MKMRWSHFSELLRFGEMIPCYTTIPVVQFCKPDFGLLFVPPPQQYYAPVLWTPLWILQKNMMYTTGRNILFSHPTLPQELRFCVLLPPPISKDLEFKAASCKNFTFQWPGATNNNSMMTKKPTKETEALTSLHQWCHNVLQQPELLFTSVRNTEWFSSIVTQVQNEVPLCLYSMCNYRLPVYTRVSHRCTLFRSYVSYTCMGGVCHAK